MDSISTRARRLSNKVVLPSENANQLSIGPLLEVLPPRTGIFLCHMLSRITSSTVLSRRFMQSSHSLLWPSRLQPLPPVTVNAVNLDEWDFVFDLDDFFEGQGGFPILDDTLVEDLGPPFVDDPLDVAGAVGDQPTPDQHLGDALMAVENLGLFHLVVEQGNPLEQLA